MATGRKPPVSRNVGIKTKSTTDQIKDVLQNYPLGTNVLKELLQNGDDAKARYMTFLLDLRTHGDEKLSHPDLKVFQGPALLVFDSALFPEKNFESMLRLQSSNKKFDPTKTGKFGVGSYSTYQITDGITVCFIFLLR
jgi:sacsin